MENLQMMNLFTDIALMMSLVYLCYRFIKASPRATGSSAELQRLEGILKALISDAENAGRTLDSQLLKRKQDLEQSLFDLEIAENRVSQTIQAAERSSGSPSANVEASAIAPEEAASTAPLAEGPQISATVSIPEPPSFIGAQRPTRLSKEIAVEEISVEEPVGNSEPELNIFGMPIGKGPDSESNTLSLQIEADIESEPMASEISSDDLTLNVKEIYSAAEDMIRSGQELPTVSAQTKLPIEEVRLLSEMITREGLDRQADTAMPGKDGRLGVLAPSIKRHSQVV